MSQRVPSVVIVTRRVALLRGINVGGRNRVPMTELRRVFTSLGFEQVGSVIQSGNVCFDQPDDGTDTAIESDLAATIGAAVTARFGVDSPVVLRTSTQFTAAVEAHPFTSGEFEPKFHHIMFLASPPDHTADRVVDLSPVDRHLVSGREVHVLYTHGSVRSKFTVANVERRLGIVATARNLPTCARILDLLTA